MNNLLSTSLINRYTSLLAKNPSNFLEIEDNLLIELEIYETTNNLTKDDCYGIMDAVFGF